jgi:hypothetical protein
MLAQEKRFFKIAGGLTLTPSVVSKTKGRIGRTVAHKKLFYSFGTTAGSGYPLELYVSLTPELEPYDIAFIQDVSGEVWAGVFLGDTRKTVLIPNENIKTHLRRYVKVLGARAAIVNNVVDIDDLDGFDFIAIEKEPRIIDPSQNAKLFIRYGSAAVAAATLYGGLMGLKGSYESNTAKLEVQRPALMQKSLEADLKLRNQQAFLPSSEIQDEQIAQMVKNREDKTPQIINGGILWH